MIKKFIKENKSEFFLSKYQKLNTKDRSLWKTTKNLIGIKDQIPPLIKPNGNLAVSDLDKADLFGEHLAKIFSSHDDIITISEDTKIIENYLDSHFPVPLPAKHTTPNAIKNIILKLKEGKSPGYDLILNKMLKHLPNKTILLIIYIFNSMLRLSYYSLIWKFSTIIWSTSQINPNT
jgi:hypothetical protein